MEKRRRALGAMVPDNVLQDRGAKTLPGVVRVGAKAADLAPGLEDKPVAAHSDQGAAGVADAEVLAHATGLLAKKARVGNCDQGHHLV